MPKSNCLYVCCFFHICYGRRLPGPINSVCVYANELCGSRDVIGCSALASEEVIGSMWTNPSTHPAHTFRGRITKAVDYDHSGGSVVCEQTPLATCLPLLTVYLVWSLLL